MPHAPRAIVDAHHHLWEYDRFPYAWLHSEAPRPFGEHRAIQRDYLPADHRAAFAGLPLAATVHVQAECGATDPAAETAWLAGRARATGLPDAVVFHTDLAAESAPAILAANASHAVARGVRAPVSWQPSGRFSFATRPGVMGEPAFRRHAALLPDMGLSLDIVVVPAQLPEVAALAAHLPGLSIAVNHLATPQAETEEVWRAGIDAIAPHANVAMKISGLWPVDRGWEAAVVAPFLHHAAVRLGAGRLMWGSNAPIDPLNCPIPRQVATLCKVFDAMPATGLDLILAGTARRFYRLAAPA